MDKRISDFIQDWNDEPEKKKSTKPLAEMLGSLALFFPKSGMCWTVYMSMLGSLGMVRSAYTVWLFPPLLLFLMLHLWALSKKVRQKIYYPFFLSLAGALLIIISKMFFPLTFWPVLTGMILLFLGTLSNSFAGSRITGGE